MRGNDGNGNSMGCVVDNVNWGLYLWVVVGVVCYLVHPGLAVETGYKNETSYTLSVKIRRCDTYDTVADVALAPGERYVWEGEPGVNYFGMPMMGIFGGTWRHIIGIGKYYGNQYQGDIIYLYNPDHPGIPRDSWDWWGSPASRQGNQPDRFDFAAGMQFNAVFRLEDNPDGSWDDWISNEEDNFMIGMSEGELGDYYITGFEEYVKITIQNNTSIDLWIRPLNGNDEFLTSGGSWITVPAGEQRWGSYVAPWHMQITNDGGTTTWDTPEPGVDKVYLVRGDGAGGLVIEEGESEGEDEVGGNLPDGEAIPEVPDEPDPLTDEVGLTDWAETFNAEGVGESTGGLFWDETLNSIAQSDWQSYAPSIGFSVGGLYDITIDLRDSNGDLFGYVYMVRWMLRLAMYFLTALLCIDIISSGA